MNGGREMGRRVEMMRDPNGLALRQLERDRGEGVCAARKSVDDDFGSISDGFFSVFDPAREHHVARGCGEPAACRVTHRMGHLGEVGRKPDQPH